MQNIRFFLGVIFLLIFSSKTAIGQEFDKNLIIGKWKFVKTKGFDEQDFKYNGEPILTFDKSGRWITDDSNPNYRQSGTWKIENKNLVRDPDKTETFDRPPYSVEIVKLTEAELVTATILPSKYYKLTFYFKRME